MATAEEVNARARMANLETGLRVAAATLRAVLSDTSAGRPLDRVSLEAIADELVELAGGAEPKNRDDDVADVLVEAIDMYFVEVDVHDDWESEDLAWSLIRHMKRKEVRR